MFYCYFSLLYVHYVHLSGCASLFCCCFLFLIFQDRVYRCSLGCPGTQEPGCHLIHRNLCFQRIGIKGIHRQRPQLYLNKQKILLKEKLFQIAFTIDCVGLTIFLFWNMRITFVCICTYYICICIHIIGSFSSHTKSFHGCELQTSS